MVDYPSQPKYWILKDSDKNAPSLDPPGFRTRIIAADLEIHSGDVAYFCRQEDLSYFYAWGRFDYEMFEGALPDNRPIGPGKLAWPIRLYAIIKPLMTREVEVDPAFSDLTELRDPQIEVFEINEIQAAALNRLIRNHGFESPAYPIVESSDESETNIG